MDLSATIRKYALQNAIKFNFKDGPEVHIRGHEDEVYYYFDVSDNGNGIDKADIEKVFTVFKSSKKRDRFGKKGNGIGLANVRKLVEFLGGQIYIKSSSEEGTTFSFSIKKALSFPCYWLGWRFFSFIAFQVYYLGQHFIFSP